MAKDKNLTAALKGLPTTAASAVAKKLAGLELSERGRIHVLTNGIPIDDLTISVLPKSATDAKKIIDALAAKPGVGRFEVFPYGIINPEIGRIDIRVNGR